MVCGGLYERFRSAGEQGEGLCLVGFTHVLAQICTGRDEMESKKKKIFKRWGLYCPVCLSMFRLAPALSTLLWRDWFSPAFNTVDPCVREAVNKFRHVEFTEAPRHEHYAYFSCHRSLCPPHIVRSTNTPHTTYVPIRVAPIQLISVIQINCCAKSLLGAL